MGAASSLQEALPEKLTKDQLEQICSHRYKDDFFESVKDERDLVDREKFIAVTSSQQEKEVFKLFMSYSVSGRMDGRQFRRLCRDSKLFKKNNFTVADADVIFEKAKAENNHSKANTLHKTVNFHKFRYTMVPEIANRKNIPVDKVIYKLSLAEETQVSRISGSFCGTSLPTEPMLGKDENELSVNEHVAAIRLQTKQRQKQAKREVDAMREAKKAVEEDKSENYLDAVEDPSSAEEVKLHDLFDMQLRDSENPGEMDGKEFIHLLYDCEVTNEKTFTRKDAGRAFLLTKARASSKSMPEDIKRGVVVDKRITYTVFRRVALRCVAEKLSKTTPEVIAKLLAMHAKDYVDPQPDESLPMEQELNKLFYSCFLPEDEHYGEMDSDTFVNICVDNEVICGDQFTAKDAAAVFHQVLSLSKKATIPDAIKIGVIHMKRINYTVFRRLAIPCIAQKRHRSSSEIIELFL